MGLRHGSKGVYKDFIFNTALSKRLSSNMPSYVDQFAASNHKFRYSYDGSGFGRLLFLKEKATPMALMQGC